ncbi:hypothetical protein ACIBAC_11205 [Streptomyces sp. NPDC051362]|uniref:hypothetical protein n=1 Tax=Streptomyces sp. NPDC051362 TaxID=3365651 RepID=UPI00379F878D
MSDYPEIAAHFAADFAEAKLTSQREDGLFRHIEFSAPKSMNRLTVITWPHNLLVAGSHGSYHFQRWGDPEGEILDMFREHSPIQRLTYWANKLAANGRDSVREYDQNRLVRQVKDEVAEAVREGAPRGLRAAVRERILEDDLLASKDVAMQLVYDFEHGVTYRAECSCGAFKDHDDQGDAYGWEFGEHRRRLSGGLHTVKVREIGGFAFSDIGDWPIHKLNYHFVYQCHAIVWAIAQYDAALKAVAA